MRLLVTYDLILFMHSGGTVLGPVILNDLEPCYAKRHCDGWTCFYKCQFISLSVHKYTLYKSANVRRIQVLKTQHSYANNPDCRLLVLGLRRFRPLASTNQVERAGAIAPSAPRRPFWAREGGDRPVTRSPPAQVYSRALK